MTGEEIHRIASDAAHLSDALKSQEFNFDDVKAMVISAMPAIVAANTGAALNGAASGTT